MALRKTIKKDVYGKEIFFENSYIKVEQVRGNKNLINFELVTYTDDTLAYELERTQLSFTPDQDEESIRWDKQCYEYAKTLSEYADVVDV